MLSILQLGNAGFDVVMVFRVQHRIELNERADVTGDDRVGGLAEDLSVWPIPNGIRSREGLTPAAGIAAVNMDKTPMRITPIVLSVGMTAEGLAVDAIVLVMDTRPAGIWGVKLISNREDWIGEQKMVPISPVSWAGG